MTETLRAELDRIEDFLMGPEGAALAAILSALRGPDNDDRFLKSKTTLHIRRAAFPRIAEESARSRNSWGDTEMNLGWVMFSPFRQGTPEPPLETSLDLCWSKHFMRHIRSAVFSLGLK